MHKKTLPDTVTLVCDLDAICASDRQTHQSLAKRLLFGACQETQALPDGYSFRFPAEEYPALAAYVANERLCCPFFTFELEVTPHQGPVWLRLRGSETIKAFLAAELNAHP